MKLCCLFGIVWYSDRKLCINLFGGNLELVGSNSGLLRASEELLRAFTELLGGSEQDFSYGYAVI